MTGIEYLPLTPALARQLDAAAEPGLVLPFGAELWAAAAAKAPDLNVVARAGGRIVGIGGVIPDQPPRATAWFMVEPLLPARTMVAIRRKCGEVIAAAQARGYRRVEAHVHERFPGGCRFARRLGFVLEGFSPCWLPDGAGVFNFARFDPPIGDPFDGLAELFGEWSDVEVME